MLTFMLAFALQQDPELDRILHQWGEKSQRAMSEEEYLQAARTAREALEKHLQKSPPDPGRVEFHLAQMHVHLQELDKAVERLDILVTTRPSHARVPDARLMAAELTMQRERDADARARIERWIRDYPNDERVFQARLYLAILDIYGRKYDTAAAALEQLRTDYRGKFPEWSAAMQLVICHHLAQESDKARRVLEEIIEKCPERSFVDSAKRLLEEYVHLGKELPSDPTTDITGATFDLSSFRGKVVVLYFYSTAIPLCDAEVHFLKQAHEQFQGKEFSIVGISIDKGREKFEQWKTIKGIPWPVYLDGNGLQGTIARQYSVRGLPALWVLDRKGRARFYNISGRDLRIAIDTLLQEKE
jgi:peroxiredoxin/TolA-binding protein